MLQLEIPRAKKGYPHSTYRHEGMGRGSSQMRMIAHKGGERVSRLRTHPQKNYFGPQNLKTFLFFVRKKLLHCHLLLCMEKCKLALSYK